MLTGSALLRHRLARLLPHLVDSRAAPVCDHAGGNDRAMPDSRKPAGIRQKVIGLLACSPARRWRSKRGRTRGVQLAAFASAILVYAWIVSVALAGKERSPAASRWSRQAPGRPGRR